VRAFLDTLFGNREIRKKLLSTFLAQRIRVRRARAETRAAPNHRQPSQIRGVPRPAGRARRAGRSCSATKTANYMARPIAAAGWPLYFCQRWQITSVVGNIVGGMLGPTSTVNVLVNGVQVYTATNSLGAGSTSTVWQKFTATITSLTTSTSIAFINGDPGNDNYNGLDGVSLVAQ
jgi:hypothetical protein